MKRRLLVTGLLCWICYTWGHIVGWESSRRARSR